MPHISSAYLIRGDLIRRGWRVKSGSQSTPEEENEVASQLAEEGHRFPSFSSSSDATLDPEIAFSRSLRSAGVFLFVSNREEYGHLIDPDGYLDEYPGALFPDLRQISRNRVDWERSFLHQDYKDSLDDHHEIPSPCPDVYWFPLVKPAFADQLVQEMEHFGRWSSGSNQDDRLATGYENVPTRDIHLNQVGLERMWLTLLREYVRPLQQRIFLGYNHDVSTTLSRLLVLTIV